jgi:DNA-binding GntR family transcriptional regulator
MGKGAVCHHDAVREARELKVVTADTGVALHRQLFLVLRDEIARGALVPGDPLPSEQSLCDQFGVSRITVRRALADLAEQGLIERRHGVGSFVRQSDSSPAPELRSYSDQLHRTQFETDVDVVEFGVRTAPPAVADALGVAGEMLHVLRVRRERRTAEPLMVTEAWLPAELSEPVASASLTEKALYDGQRPPARRGHRLGAHPGQPAGLCRRQAASLPVDRVVAQSEPGFGQSGAGAGGWRARHRPRRAAVTTGCQLSASSMASS